MWSVLKRPAKPLQQSTNRYAVVESADAACVTSCDCIWINFSIRLLLPDPFDEPLPDPPFDESLPWGTAGVVVLTVVPSAYVIVVVLDPSALVAV